MKNTGSNEKVEIIAPAPIVKKCNLYTPYLGSAYEAEILSIRYVYKMCCDNDR